MSDEIVYVVWSKAGGIDGMDPDAKPAKKQAFFQRKEAEKACDAWSEVKAEIVEGAEARREQIIAKMDPVDRLLVLCYRGNVTREATPSNPFNR